MGQAKPTVFIVDDDEAVRDSLRMLMKSIGLSAECYASANEFLEAYDPDRPGCLVLDVRMPGINGVEAFRQIRRHQEGVRVILMSAYSVEHVERDALAQGVVAFVQKPLDAAKVLELVRSVREGSQAEKIVKNPAREG